MSMAWWFARREEIITHDDSNDLDEINEIRLDEIDKMLRYFSISFRQFCNPISPFFLSLYKLFAKRLQTIQSSVHKRSCKSTRVRTRWIATWHMAWCINICRMNGWYFNVTFNSTPSRRTKYNVQTYFILKITNVKTYSHDDSNATRLQLDCIASIM